MVMDYDIVVIGAGLIGSAAAKYVVSQQSELHACLIGAPETTMKDQAKIHGAHYDEARITKMADPNATWGLLAKRSIQRYREIEKQSGLTIFTECGFMAVGTANGTYINRIKAFTAASNIECDLLQSEDLIQLRFPFASFGENVNAVHTSTNSGHINPRTLVKAQKVIAGKLGCQLIEDVVQSVRCHQSEPEGYTIKTQNGLVVTTRKVLLCTGGFTHCMDLLPTGVIPKMYHHPNTVILVEVDDEEQRDLHNMPCITYKAGRWDQPDINFVAYILPPVKYPDGKYYLKIGHGRMEPYLLHTPKEIRDWYCGGKQPKVEEYLIDVTRSLFPGLKMKQYKFDYCVTTNTTKDYPYVDLVSPTFGVAIGGCGQSAKSSDEIGKMAAQMIIRGAWHHDLSQELFHFEAEEIAQSKL